ncbi:MAG: hypothetical protein ACR5KW_00590 [Wolbachia sp.]
MCKNCTKYYVQILKKEVITSIKVIRYFTVLKSSKEDLEVAKDFILMLSNIGVELKAYIINTKSGHVNLIEQDLIKTHGYLRLLLLGDIK